MQKIEFLFISQRIICSVCVSMLTKAENTPFTLRSECLRLIACNQTQSGLRLNTKNISVKRNIMLRRNNNTSCSIGQQSLRKFQTVKLLLHYLT